MKSHSKKATARVLRLAKSNPKFRREFLREISRHAGERAVRDIAVDHGTQQQMLMNMVAGDRVRIVYEPDPPVAPREHVDRIVQSRYNEVLKGVTLRTPDGDEGVLVDKGDPQGIMFWDGPGESGFQVVELRLNRWWPRVVARERDKSS